MPEVRISVRRLTFVSLLTQHPFQVEAQVCCCDLNCGIAVINHLFWSIDAVGLFLAGILFDCRILLGHDSNAAPSNCVKKGCAAICPEGLFIIFPSASWLSLALLFTSGSCQARSPQARAIGILNYSPWVVHIRTLIAVQIRSRKYRGSARENNCAREPCTTTRGWPRRSTLS